MSRRFDPRSNFPTRLASLTLPIGSFFLIGTLVGCTAPWTKEPPSDLELKGKAVREVLNAEDHPRLIHEVASTVGFTPQVYESFGLVTGLVETGGDVKPSPQRDHVINDMRANDVPNPNKILASPSTAVVQVRTMVPPGIPKNHRADAIVKISSQCDATSLEYGYLMETRLQELQILNGTLRKGMEKARAKGPILQMPRGFHAPGDEPRSEVDYRVGIVLGGARSLDPRILGLHIREGVAHVMTSSAVAKAINQNYFVFDGAKRRGVAIPKDDDFIQIDVPEKYRQDPDHFFNVLLQSPFMEKPAEKAERLANLTPQLRDPTTARRAALQYEALGKEGIEGLRAGLQNPDQEIRFYCAYSLAYLDDESCVSVLEKLAKEVPAFRKLALVGLCENENHEGLQALLRLLQDPTPEVRYGAVDALRQREDAVSVLNERDLGGIVRILDIPSDTPLIAVSLQERPEIALFGYDAVLPAIDYIEISPRLIARTDGNTIRFKSFMPQTEDLVVNTEHTLHHFLEGIQKSGGTYNDMVQGLDRLREKGLLPLPIAYNPRPDFGRTYHRDGSDPSLGTDQFSSELPDEPAEIRQAEEDKPKSPAWYDPRRFWTSDTKDAE